MVSGNNNFQLKTSAYVPMRRSCGCGSLRPPVPITQPSLEQNKNITQPPLNNRQTFPPNITVQNIIQPQRTILSQVKQPPVIFPSQINKSMNPAVSVPASYIPPTPLPPKQYNTEFMKQSKVTQREKSIEVKPSVEVKPNQGKKAEIKQSFFFGNPNRVISAFNSLNKSPIK